MYSGPATKRPRSGPAHPVTTYHSRSSKSAATSSSMQSSQGSTGQGRVLVNPKKFNPAEKARLAEELREKKYRNKLYHHFSSTDIRRMATSESSKTFMCCVCKDLEPVSISI